MSDEVFEEDIQRAVIAAFLETVQDKGIDSGVTDFIKHNAPWTPFEVALLGALLRKVQAQNYFWPEDASVPKDRKDWLMEVLHATVSMWAPEIVLTREHPTRQVYIGTYDGGAGFPPGMTHLFGGYNRYPETDIQASIDRIGRREIGSAKLVFERVIGHHKWTTEEHPYGHPLSLYCLCRAEGALPEDDKHWFAGADGLPGSLVAPHMRFARALLAAPDLRTFYFSDESI